MTTFNPGYVPSSGRISPHQSGERYVPSSGRISPHQSGERYPPPPPQRTHKPHNNPHNSHSNMSEHPNHNVNHSVGFSSRNMLKDDYQDERKKYLTAKYPQHQMRLIRKRLQVEDWVDTRLRELYNVVDDTDTYDCEIDLDDLLDLDLLSERRSFILERISNIRKSPDVINQFVEELLEKASTL